MANTLTDLTPDLYQALDTVSRELVGFIPSVTLDSGIERAAVGQQVRSFVTPTSTASDITPGINAPNDGDQVIGNQSMTITKARAVPVRYNGEEQRGLNSGAGYRSILQDQFAQAMRTLVNEMESDLASLHATTSRAFGTAGTTPFASDLSDTAQVRKILADNGAPMSEMQLVIDTTAGAKMRTLTQLTKANEAADNTLLRQGVLLDVHGMTIRESAQVVTTGTNCITGAVTVTGTNAIGVTAIGVTTAGGAAVAALPGDVITFAGDTNKYVITTAVTIGAGTTGVITIAAPGLRIAKAGATAISGVAAAARSMAFNKAALVLATRAPARPEEGDMADDVITVVDPRSGISFEVALYKQYRQIRYEVSAAWGVKNFKPEHSAILLG
ncbi:major capsid protein [Paraglaciecola Antarctic JLT virus 2]|nr:major capsid protein [Paraglaciecola Antarctic JLT virus 2]